MTKILILGAGRSATSLIEYFLSNSNHYNWQVTIADIDVELVQSRIKNFETAQAVLLDINNKEQSRSLIQECDFVISLLPAFMHVAIAKYCLDFNKHLATASYVSEEMRALDSEAKNKQLFFLNECGLDPGLDHASAKKIIDEIHEQGGVIDSFKSYCGGLVAPQSNDNPWGYKFSWNPRNVILAGQGTSQFLESGELKFIPYNRLFLETQKIKTETHGLFEAYANRDSIGYQEIYKLEHVKTMLRGTLREVGYCEAWNVFIQLGLTDDTSKIKNASKLTYKNLIDSFLPNSGLSTKEKVKHLMKESWNSEIEHKLDYLELFSDKKINLTEGTPAQILQKLLEEKWKLNTGDRDMIVMQHEMKYVDASNNRKQITSSLVLEGKDQQHTAMALTVGLPLAITVKNFLSKKINLTGVQIPTSKIIYEPMLNELKLFGIDFEEKKIQL